MEQQSAADSVVHELAKPVARTLAWSAVCLALAGLAAGAWRNLQDK